MTRRRTSLAIDAAAFAAGLGLTVAIFLWLDLRKDAEPIDNWLTVRAIAVPDFVIGSDPSIVYDREVRRPIFVNWSARISAVPPDRNFFCRASISQRLDAGDELPLGGVPMSALFKPPCRWRAGTYVLEAAWEVIRDGYPPKVVSATSNLFRVLPEGAQLYITPEQVEKLEAE